MTTNTLATVAARRLAGHRVLPLVAANILLVVCAHIAVPVPGSLVPIALTSFAVTLVGVLLGPRRGALVLIAYLLEGAAGLPVFAPVGAPGMMRFIGPTAGYLYAFPVAAYLTGLLARNGDRLQWPRVAAAIVAGHVLILAGGCAWLIVALHMSASKAIASGVTPFLFGDMLKTVLATTIAVGLHSWWGGAAE
jgi:biotin transport system substrate-specific component